MKYFKLDENNNPVSCAFEEWHLNVKDEKYNICNFKHGSFLVNIVFNGIKIVRGGEMFEVITWHEKIFSIKRFFTYKEAMSFHYSVINAFFKNMSIVP